MLPVREVLTCAAAGLMMAGAMMVMASAGSAGPVPDSMQMSELRRTAAKAPVLLVRGDFGLVEVRKALLDSTGVRSTSWESAAHVRPAIVTADAPPPVRMPIPWSGIESIETQHQQKTKFALMGGITGLAAGLLIAGTSSDTSESDAIGKAGWVIGGPMLGMIGGFVIGSFVGTKTVYSSPPQESS